MTAVLLFIIAAFVFAVLFGRFARAGAGPEQIADQMHAIKEKCISKEDGWIAELEQLRTHATAQLETLTADALYSVEDLKKTCMLRASIANADKCLQFLYTRRDAKTPAELRESAATFLEGRM